MFAEKDMNIYTPKAFISYSWSSPGHCERIRSYAERLLNDGVEVVLDQWSLSEGQDKYAFMEKMVSDPSVTHVLIFSDGQYAEKADQRKAGVGTETQIISKEVYDKIDQRKFIPIVCERQENGEPLLPTFLRARIWIDFSTPEAANDNWERLLRALYGKPIHEKPSIGKPPSFLDDDISRPSLPTVGKFSMLRDALLNGKRTVQLCRKDFINATISYVDALRVRSRPDIEHIDEKVLSDFHSLLPLRDQFVEWMLLEASLQTPEALDAVLVEFLELLLALKYRPPEVTSWNETWFDAHKLFVYEVFLYLIAALLKSDKYTTVRTLLTTNYILPESEASRGRDFAAFDEFYTHSESLAYRNNRLKMNRISVIADVVKERATRKDIPFQDIMQAELVVLLVALLSDDRRWYPHTLVYYGRGSHRFPLFVRAAQRKYFTRLQTITGIATGEELRKKFKEGCEKHGIKQWTGLMFWADVSLWNSMNMDALDTMN